MNTGKEEFGLYLQITWSYLYQILRNHQKAHKIEKVSKFAGYKITILNQLHIFILAINNQTFKKKSIPFTIA